MNETTVAMLSAGTLSQHPSPLSCRELQQNDGEHPNGSLKWCAETLFNLCHRKWTQRHEPPYLQFVRKLGGFAGPSEANSASGSARTWILQRST